MECLGDKEHCSPNKSCLQKYQCFMKTLIITVHFNHLENIDIVRIGHQEKRIFATKFTSAI